MVDDGKVIPLDDPNWPPELASKCSGMNTLLAAALPLATRLMINKVQMTYRQIPLSDNMAWLEIRMLTRICGKSLRQSSDKISLSGTPMTNRASTTAMRAQDSTHKVIMWVHRELLPRPRVFCMYFWWQRMRKMIRADSAELMVMETMVTIQSEGPDIVEKTTDENLDQKRRNDNNPKTGMTSKRGKS